MKHTGILFSTAMIMAILEGRKTQTRRVVKQAMEWDHNWKVSPITGKQMGGIQRYEMRCGTQYALPWFRCPYGAAGDLLYVRETFYAWGKWVQDGITKTGKQKWQFMDLTKSVNGRYLYCDDNIDKMGIAPNTLKDGKAHWYKRPSMFMPKAAVRLFLQVEDIRVERLEEISHSDAVAEGINYVIDKVTGFCGYDYLSGGYNLMTTGCHSYLSLWRKINKIERFASTGNPWVWVVKFKRIDKPVNFQK